MGAKLEKARVNWTLNGIAPQLAWAVDCLSNGSLAKNHLIIEGCLDELFYMQRANRSWASEDGEGFAMGATIQVLQVLKRYTLLPSDLDRSYV
jgi:hypothetical protein